MILGILLVISCWYETTGDAGVFVLFDKCKVE